MIKRGRNYSGDSRNYSACVDKETNPLFPLNTLICINKNSTVNSKILEAEDRGPGDLTVHKRCGESGTLCSQNMKLGRKSNEYVRSVSRS